MSGVSGRSYRGPAVDGTVQHIGEAPYWQNNGETVDVVDDADVGEERTEGVPVPGEITEAPEDADGQTTLDEWRWSA
ncbi:hypothetical protein VB779_08585 [Haloarculaceae archaeon H-GB11]|nr:hypothetical protein [Haloarculaceae archaeon H-GB11]